jgi:hypothetical protein
MKVIPLCSVFVLFFFVLLPVYMDYPLLIAPFFGILKRLFQLLHLYQKINSFNALEEFMAQANTNNVTKRCALLQTTGCKDEPTRLIYLQVNLFHLFSYLG